MESTRKRELVGDQKNELGFHEAKRVRTSTDRQSIGDAGGGLDDDIERGAIAGVESGPDEEGDQRGDRNHDEESQEPPLLRGDPTDGVLRHVRDPRLASVATTRHRILGLVSANEGGGGGGFRTFGFSGSSTLGGSSLFAGRCLGRDFPKRGGGVFIAHLLELRFRFRLINNNLFLFWLIKKKFPKTKKRKKKKRNI